MLALLLLTLGTSFLLGMRHATDADHVVAVTTIVSQERRLGAAARIGALWGVGHTLTILAVGGAIVLLRVALTPRVGLSLEFTVAVMLVVLGLLNLFDVGTPTSGITTLRPLLVGIVHGLAGSAAATLLITSLIADPLVAVAFLGVFGVGTIVGMAVITAAIAAPAAFAAHRIAGVQRWVRRASGLVSVCFGLYLAQRIGFHDGLFTSAPVWTPG